MTATLLPFRPGFDPASMVQTALAAIGRIEAVPVAELRHHLAIARSGRTICEEIDVQLALTGTYPTDTQEAAYTAAERAEEAAHKAITALFAGLTAQERRQLGSIL